MNALPLDRTLRLARETIRAADELRLAVNGLPVADLIEIVPAPPVDPAGLIDA